MDSGGFNWAILNIIGPLLIVIVLAWAVLRNRKSTKAENDRTEAATRNLYREEDAAHRNDTFLKVLWETLQSMPEYAGRTSLVITTDHGRGGTKLDWTDHGKDVEGAEFMWAAVMGPTVHQPR